MGTYHKRILSQTQISPKQIGDIMSHDVGSITLTARRRMLLLLLPLTYWPRG